MIFVKELRHLLLRLFQDLLTLAQKKCEFADRASQRVSWKRLKQVSQVYESTRTRNASA